MSPAHGIKREDWARLQTLSFELFDAVDTEQEADRRRQLLAYLDALESRYGPLPNILATRADFVESDAAKESVLRRAYQRATELGDPENELLVAHSLADYFMERANHAEARQWLNAMREHLASVNDSYMQQELLRMSAKLTGK